MKPSGVGGEYAALIFKICATNVGSFGIQFPITIRPPGRVTRTISLATSNGPWREHRSKDAHDEIKRMILQLLQIGGITFLNCSL
jgi:hypothetical protein